MNGFAGYCNVGTLRNDTFLNTSHLERLEIVHCGVKLIEPEAFSPLRNLRYLDLSYNEELGFRRLAHGTYGLVNSSLRELRIDNIHRRFATCTYVLWNHLIYLQHTPLETISLSENRISKIGSGVLQMIPKSVTKIVARNNIFTIGSYIHELHYLENVTVLDLSYTHFYEYSYNFIGSPNDDEDDIDQSCGHALSYHSRALDSDTSKTIPKGQFAVKSQYTEQTLSADPDYTEVKPSKYAASFYLPNKLRRLSFRWNRMYYDIPVVNVSARDLKTLDFSHNFFPHLQGPIDGVQNLTKLNMSHTSVIKIGRYFFMYFTALENLDLSYNYLENLLSSNESFEVFGWLQNLQVLDLRGNGLCRVHDKAFEGLQSLKVLYLQNNKLIMETFQISHSSLKQLSVLNLRSNAFSKLDDTLYKALDRQDKKARIRLNLADNPLTCSCKNLDFLVWMYARMVHNNSYVIFDRNGNYTCLNQDGSVRVFDVEGRELNNIRTSCVNTELLTTVLVVAFLLILTLIIGAILYRYRWRIRYAYYSGKKATRALPLGDFLFDAFVSYAEDDAGFVRTLTDTLEGRGVRLCIPDRDCSANLLEITAIVNAIQASRHVVCVLSRQYLQGYWHQYEMHMALQAGIHSGRDNVLMLLYDRNLRARSLPAEVLYCIQADSYLDYPQDQRCLAYFWDNLDRALRPNGEQLLSACQN